MKMPGSKVVVEKVREGVLKARCPLLPLDTVEAIRNAIELFGLAELNSATVFRFAEDKKKEFIELLSKKGFEVEA